MCAVSGLRRMDAKYSLLQQKRGSAAAAAGSGGNSIHIFPGGAFIAPIFGTFLSWQCSSSSTLYIQRWTEKLVRGCKIFCQSYRKLQIGRWGVASLPWQHYSGKFKISFFLVKPCTVLVCPFQEYLWGPFSGPFLDPF